MCCVSHCTSPLESVAPSLLIASPTPAIPIPEKGNHAGMLALGRANTDQEAPIDQSTPKAIKVYMSTRMNVATPKVPTREGCPSAFSKCPTKTGFHELRNMGTTRSRRTRFSDTRPRMYGRTASLKPGASVAADRRAIASSTDPSI